MTTVEEVEQTISVTEDNITKEEENIKEDKMLEDPYDMMIEMLITMTTNIMVKLEEVLRQQEQQEAILLMTKKE